MLKRSPEKGPEAARTTGVSLGFQRGPGNEQRKPETIGREWAGLACFKHCRWSKGTGKTPKRPSATCCQTGMHHLQAHCSGCGCKSHPSRLPEAALPGHQPPCLHVILFCWALLHILAPCHAQGYLLCPGWAEQAGMGWPHSTSASDCWLLNYRPGPTPQATFRAVICIHLCRFCFSLQSCEVSQA